MLLFKAKIDLDTMSKEEIDSIHRAKRKHNIKIAIWFIYSLIFMFVLSLGHSFQVAKENFILELNIKNISKVVEELQKENEFLRQKDN